MLAIFGNINGVQKKEKFKTKCVCVYVHMYTCISTMILARTVRCKLSTGRFLILSSPNHRTGQKKHCSWRTGLSVNHKPELLPDPGLHTKFWKKLHLWGFEKVHGYPLILRRFRDPQFTTNILAYFPIFLPINLHLGSYITIL